MSSKLVQRDRTRICGGFPRDGRTRRSLPGTCWPSQRCTRTATAQWPRSMASSCGSSCTRSRPTSSATPGASTSSRDAGTLRPFSGLSTVYERDTVNPVIPGQQSPSTPNGWPPCTRLPAIAYPPRKPRLPDRHQKLPATTSPKCGKQCSRKPSTGNPPRSPQAIHPGQRGGAVWPLRCAGGESLVACSAPRGVGLAAEAGLHALRMIVARFFDRLPTCRSSSVTWVRWFRSCWVASSRSSAGCPAG